MDFYKLNSAVVENCDTGKAKARQLHHVLRPQTPIVQFNNILKNP